MIPNANTSDAADGEFLAELGVDPDAEFRLLIQDVSTREER